MSTLSICSLNVNGLQSKLNAGILDFFLRNNGIICLTETKTNSPDLYCTHLSNFHSYVKESDHGRLGGFHGLCVLVRDDLFPYTTKIIGTTSESVLWIHIDKKYLGFDFILGAVYLPCEGSIHHTNEVFDLLAQDLVHLKGKYDVPFCLTGDFNARTGLLDDFMVIEDVISDLTGFVASNDNNDFQSYLKDNGIDTKRYNKDECVNNNGRQILEICQSFDLKIVNGRIGGDKGVGNYTCYNKNGGKSVVDYVIDLASFFQHILNFQIDVFDKCIVLQSAASVNYMV